MVIQNRIVTLGVLLVVGVLAIILPISMEWIEPNRSGAVGFGIGCLVGFAYALIMGIVGRTKLAGKGKQIDVMADFTVLRASDWLILVPIVIGTVVGFIVGA